MINVSCSRTQHGDADELELATPPVRVEHSTIESLRSHAEVVNYKNSSLVWGGTEKNSPQESLFGIRITSSDREEWIFISHPHTFFLAHH